MALVWASLRSGWLRSTLASRALAFLDAKPEVFYALAFLTCFEMAVLFNDVRFAAHFAARGLLHTGAAGLSGQNLGPAAAASAFVASLVIGAYLLSRAWDRFPLGREVRRHG